MLLLLVLAISVKAQISGVVIDAQSGDTILYPSASYKDHQVAVSGNAYGEYTIARHNGWKLVFSAVGYKSKTIVVNANTPSKLDVKLSPDTRMLSEFVVKKKRNRYSRKDNPAVELMRRVIAAKKRTNLQNHDYYQYTKYQKLTTALNDISGADIDSGFIGKHKWMLDQVEMCPYNNKLILPLIVDETVSQHIFRKIPERRKTSYRVKTRKASANSSRRATLSRWPQRMYLPMSTSTTTRCDCCNIPSRRPSEKTP